MDSARLAFIVISVIDVILDDQRVIISSHKTSFYSCVFTALDGDTVAIAPTRNDFGATDGERGAKIKIEGPTSGIDDGKIVQFEVRAKLKFERYRRRTLIRVARKSRAIYHPWPLDRESAGVHS